MSTQENVKQLISMVVAGKFVEAIEQFYSDGASMQENNGPPLVGLAALVENERIALTRMSQLHTTAASHVVDGDRAAINWIFEFIDPQGNRRRLDEIAYQLWRGGKIVEERFFYDPAQRTAAVSD
jgi:SnoaL-like domain